VARLQSGNLVIDRLQERHVESVYHGRGGPGGSEWRRSGVDRLAERLLGSPIGRCGSRRRAVGSGGAGGDGASTDQKHETDEADGCQAVRES
jgi:hypothetical protein